MTQKVLHILTVILALLAAWYVAVVPMNIKSALTTAERAGADVVPAGAKERRDLSAIGLVATNSFAIAATFSQDRPRLPAPIKWPASFGKPRLRKK